MDNDLLDIIKLRRYGSGNWKLIDARLYFVSIFIGIADQAGSGTLSICSLNCSIAVETFSTVITLVFPCLVLLHAMGYIALRELDGQEDAADYRWGHSPDTGGYQWQDHL